ncbi:hypothetical protein BJV82DRAFT_673431 [Fennellomyces sp. T-0311]|nr:hypothetical protein BJV82DRAFT_673431 [Fennellomyces sp. T-0311]
MSEPCITNTKAEQEKNAQRAAQIFIRKSPRSAIGYLASGVLYKNQNNIQEALDVYRQGLQLVSSMDGQYNQLLCEERALSAMLVKHRCGFYQRLPYDIICRIFGFLDYKTLLQCVNVCQEWCDFLLNWPDFWRILSKEAPQVSRSTWISLMRHQAQELDLRGPMSAVPMYNFFTFLLHSNNRHIQKLSFCDFIISEPNAVLLGQVLESMQPSLKHIRFIDCDIHPDSVVGPILTSCTAATYVSFSRSTRIPRSHNYVSRPSKSQITSSSMNTYSVTYLKLAFEYPPNLCLFQVDTNQLCGVIRQCPNLIHLFMDSGGSAHHGYCITEALKHCPNIKNIIVNDKAEMPQTVTSTITEREYDSSVTSPCFSRPSSRTKGLCRLVLGGGAVKLGYQDLMSIFKRTYKTLELLYLHYNGTTITASSLNKLASYGTPRLREIRLSTEDDASSENRQQPITKALAALFASSPALEAIDINNTFNTLASFSRYDAPDTAGILEVDDKVLRSIAKSCPKIRHIRVAGEHRFTKEGMLYFATKGGSGLIYLEADLDRSSVLPVVQKLGSLQRLHLRKDAYRVGEEVLGHCEETAVRRILQERGGRLVVV